MILSSIDARSAESMIPEVQRAVAQFHDYRREGATTYTAHYHSRYEVDQLEEKLNHGEIEESQRSEVVRVCAIYRAAIRKGFVVDAKNYLMRAQSKGPDEVLTQEQLEMNVDWHLEYAKKAGLNVTREMLGAQLQKDEKRVPRELEEAA